MEELLEGLDPRDLDGDTDNDSFRDLAEVNAGTDGRNPNEYPLPDGDIYPLGAPDGVTDLRDVLFAFHVSETNGPLRGGDPDPEPIVGSGLTFARDHSSPAARARWIGSPG